jgi:hypothetical protein
VLNNDVPFSGRLEAIVGVLLAKCQELFIGERPPGLQNHGGEVFMLSTTNCMINFTRPPHAPRSPNQAARGEQAAGRRRGNRDEQNRRGQERT